MLDRWFLKCGWLVAPYLLLIIYSNIRLAQAYSWTAEKNPVTQVLNSDATLTWLPVSSSSENLISIQCSHAPFSATVLGGLLFKVVNVTDEGRSRYPGNRLQAAFTQDRFTLTLKTLQYADDSITFACRATFQNDNGATYGSTVNITLNVVGPPEICETSVPTGNLSFNLAQRDANFSILLCGNPRPSVTWEFDGVRSVDNGSLAAGPGARRHQYTFTFGALSSSMCGKVLSYVAANEHGSLTDQRSVNLVFTPEKVTGVVGSVQQNFSHDCIDSLLWSPVPRGNCHVAYEIIVVKPDSTYKSTSRNGNVTMNSSICFESESLDAVYKVQVRAVLSPDNVGNWSDVTKLAFIPYQGGPFICGHALTPLLQQPPATSSFTLDICGGDPAPAVLWSFAGSNQTSSYVENPTLHQYRFNYSFPPLSGALCGTSLIYKASGFGPPLTGEIVVEFAFDPGSIQVASATTRYVGGNTCMLLSWAAAPSGNCDIRYQVNVYNSSALLGAFNFSKADERDGFVGDLGRLCFDSAAAGNITKVGVRAIWTTISEVVGNWTYADVTSVTQPLVKDSVSYAGLIGGVVAGGVALLIIMAILILLVAKRKRRKSGSRSNDIRLKKPPEACYDEVGAISSEARPSPAVLYAVLDPDDRDGLRPLPHSPDDYASVKTDGLGYPAVGGDHVPPQYASVNKERNQPAVDATYASADSVRPRAQQNGSATDKGSAFAKGASSNSGYATSGGLDSSDYAAVAF